MSRVVLFFSFLVMSVSVNAQERTASPNTTLVHQDSIKAGAIQFEQMEYDFGKIPQGKPVTHIFTFTNKSNTPVSLASVHASCGCTTPEWSKEAVPPGGSSQIKVGYNSAAEGEFAKTITINYNGDQTEQLIIKGNVWKTPVTSAPENNALNQIKKKQ